MKAAVINLTTRIDRLHAVRKQFESFGLKEYDVFPAYNSPDALRANARSHMELIKNGYNLIFEDDVFFEGTIDQLPLSELPPDWDILYLGGNVIEPLKRFSANLHRCTAAWGSFAIMYSPSGLQYVKDCYRIEPFTIYDEWLRVRSKATLQAYILSTPIAWTRGGYSDVNHCIENYEPQMRKNARVNIV